jgi:glutamyl-tRNA reductase
MAARELGSLENKNVAVLGAGDIARAVLTHLTTMPRVRVTVLNRTWHRAIELAGEHGVEAVRWSELPQAIASADVIFGCTGSRTPVLDAVTVERSKSRDLLCVDLGLPRDIDSAVAALPGVRLIDLQTIERETSARRADESAELARAESIVSTEAERYMEWWRGRGVAGTIARLRARADAIRDAEIERALARLPDLTPQSRSVVRDLAMRMAAKLLHEPTVALKRDPEGANMAVVVERLFGLTDARDLALEQCARGDRTVTPTIPQESRAS